jgi:PD-(D/E)XK nuclease superfamily
MSAAPDRPLHVHDLTFAFIYQAQSLSYLKRSGASVGLLINFHAKHRRNGVKRMVNRRDWERL